MSDTFQRPALDLMAELRRGRFADELTIAIHDLLAAVSDTGKKGSLVVQLTFEPDTKAGEDDTPRVNVTDQIQSKTPRRTVKPSLFFIDEGGNAVRTDPYQREFPTIRDVSAPADTTNTDRKAN